MDNSELNRVKQTFDRLNKAKTEAAALEAELAVVKKQAKALFTKHGISSFAELSTLQEKLVKMDEEIKAKEQQALAYIEEVNKVKTEKENLMIGV